MSTTRVIDGQTHAGTPQQLDLYEQYIAIRGAKVMFPTERGLRRGTVTGYSMSGGGSTGWHLGITVTYRNGQYSVGINDVEAA